MVDSVSALDDFSLHSGRGHISEVKYTHDEDSTATTTMTTSTTADPVSALPPDVQGPAHRAPRMRKERILPPRDVTDESIADAYSAFILYCNPHFPLDVDTSELERTFRSPPRSDGKEFSIYTLWVLIRRFDRKEIKTWAQLALDLGVEPPSVERGGSAQKVQQYSVRLKRWMRAMHVDAFFEYLLGKQHSYFTDLPPPHDPYPAQGRDGVAPEEDLAIRAIDHSFRPKRGRKRNDSPEPEHPPPKRPLLTTSFTFEGQTLYAQPQSAHPASGIPLSALPLSARPDGPSEDPWAAASAVSSSELAPRAAETPQSTISTRPPQHHQWRNTPIAQYPMSAIEPRAPYSAHESLDEPQSAVMPSSSKTRRRKHGPAVSSAWPNAGSSSTTKLRGRPPVNRSVQDGPFNTFPVDLNAERSPSSQRTTPVVSLAADTHARPQVVHQSAYTASGHRTVDDRSPVYAAHRRPERGSLQLHVPEHSGDPIRLATPTVLVNGDADSSSERTSADMDTRRRSAEGHYSSSAVAAYGDEPASRFGARASSPPPSEFAYEALKRALATALLRADFSGRRKRLLGNEAKRLADAMLKRLEIPRADTESKSDDAVRMSAASWLGLSSQFNFQAGTPCREMEIVVHRYLIAPNGLRTELSPDQEGDNVVERFEVSWSLGFGGVGGQFAAVDLELEPEQVDPEDPEMRAVKILHDVAGKPDREVDWKARFMALDLSVRLMKGQHDRLQNRVLDAIL